MLKSHIAKIERVKGGFNIEMLEFELDYRWDLIKNDPQFAFRFQMRLSDAISLADAIYNYKRAKFKVEEKKKADQQPLTPIFPNVEISKYQTLPGSPQPDTGVLPTPPAGSPPPPTVPQSGLVAGIRISPPAVNADPVPVSRPGMPPKGVGPKPVIGGRKYVED